MLRIIEGGFYSEAFEKIKKEILALTERRKRVFLIVPEQQSVLCEKEMIEYLPEYAPLTFELTNFTRLADTVSRSLGGIAGEFASPAKEALIMWRTLSENSEKLPLTKKGEINAGLVDRMLSAIAEMQNMSVGADRLAELSEDEKLKGSKRLSSKLSELALVMEKYKENLSEKYADAKDSSARLADKLEKNPNFFRDTAFYISGFTSFTEPQLKVIGELIRSSSLTVHLTISKRHSDFFEFREIKRTKERLIKLSGDRAPDRAEYSAPMEDTAPYLSDICDLLWRNFGKIDNESLQNNKEKLRIFEASDPYEEANFIAADIKRQVMEGAAYRDIAIVARDCEKYTGILSASLDQAKIPAFISKRRDLSSTEAVKLIYAAIECVESGFAREDVISYAKCTVSGIGAAECDEFELYCDTWQLDRSSFTEGNEWTMDPDGYDGRMSEASKERLFAVNATRVKIMTPLLRLRQHLLASRTTLEFATALVKFLEEISFEERINEVCDTLYSLGEDDAARECEAIWEVICSALDALVETLSDTETTVFSFLSQLKVVISKMDIGKIPSYFDTVTVGSADMIRLSDKKHVYLIGVNNGEFPRSVSADSYFTERDKLTLSELGMEFDSGSEILTARELFFFSRAFASAKRGVTLLYSTRDEAFSETHPADVIERLSKLSDGKISPRKISALSPSETVFFPNAAIKYADRGRIRELLLDTGLEREIRLSESDIVNSDSALSPEVTELLAPTEIALSQTKIDKFFDCPFAYYLKYSIKISEREKAKFDANDIGTFVHAILESFFKEVKEKKLSVNNLTDENRVEMIERAAREHIESKDTSGAPSGKRNEIFISRIIRATIPVVDGLCDELSGCDFVPEFFELKIGRDKKAAVMPAEFKDSRGIPVSLTGYVDRVDAYKSGDDVYVRVIDYKTGSKEFSPTDYEEGKNLQMFLYLRSIVESERKELREALGVGEGGRIIPAGVIYISTDIGDVTVSHANKAKERAAIAEKQLRQGMLLNDSVSIDAMNKKYLPIKFNDKGEMKSTSEQYLYTEEELRVRNEKIADKVREVADGIKSGSLPLSQKKKDSPCKYCRFKPICRKKQ